MLFTNRFLSEFVREDMSDKAFAYLAPNLLPALFSIFTNPASNVEFRSGAVGIIGEFVQFIYMVKEEHPEGKKRSLLHYPSIVTNTLLSANSCQGLS